MIDPMPVTPQFSGISHAQLHYVYGTNCYQHAIGFPTPVVQILDPAQNGNLTLRYLALAPGTYDEWLAPQNPEEFSRYVVSCCEEDGMIDLRGNFDQRKGFRTIAIFTGEHGYHFAHLNEGGLWEGKYFFGKAETFQSTSEAATAGDYRFKSYGLMPLNAKPRCLEKIDLNNISLDSRNSIAVINPESAHKLSYVEVIMNVNANQALLGRKQVSGPMPQLSTEILKPNTPWPSAG